MRRTPQCQSQLQIDHSDDSSSPVGNIVSHCVTFYYDQSRKPYVPFFRDLSNEQDSLQTSLLDAKTINVILMITN